MRRSTRSAEQRGAFFRGGRRGCVVREGEAPEKVAFGSLASSYKRGLRLPGRQRCTLKKVSSLSCRRRRQSITASNRSTPANDTAGYTIRSIKKCNVRRDNGCVYVNTTVAYRSERVPRVAELVSRVPQLPSSAPWRSNSSKFVSPFWVLE